MAAAESNPGGPSNFEFEALRQANHYRRALLSEFRPWLRGDVIEVGAGIGQFTELIQGVAEVRQVLAVEPDHRFCAELRRRLPPDTVVEGTFSNLPAATECDALVSVNVLEHIQDDARELAAYASILRSGADAFVCLCRPDKRSTHPSTASLGTFADTRSRSWLLGFARPALLLPGCIISIGLVILPGGSTSGCWGNALSHEEPFAFSIESSFR